jgi:hypothetical protein
VGTFRGSPKQIKPLAGNGPRGVYVFHGLAKMFRARVICGVCFYGSLPVVYCRKPDIHAMFPCRQHDSGTFPSGPTKHIYDIKSLFHKTILLFPIASVPLFLPEAILYIPYLEQGVPKSPSRFLLSITNLV